MRQSDENANLPATERRMGRCAAEGTNRRNRRTGLFVLPESCYQQAPCQKALLSPRLHFSELTKIFISSSPICQASSELPLSSSLTISTASLLDSTASDNVISLVGTRPKFGSKLNGAWYKICDSTVKLNTSLRGSR